MGLHQINTFLPYPSFKQSAECLDKKRCFKQVVEARQILTALEFKRKQEGHPSSEKTSRGWVNHPATLMWEGYEEALSIYYNTFYNVCVKKWNIQFEKCQKIIFDNIEVVWKYPKWLGIPLLHASHRGRLLDKKLEHYSQFGWEEEAIPESVGYWWPVRTKKCDNSKILEWFSSRYRLINFNPWYHESSIYTKMVKNV